MCKKCNKNHLNNNREDICMKKICWLINNKTEYITLASCCGHGIYPMSIIVSDKRSRVLEYFSQINILRKKKYYKKDKHGYYYIPEVVDEN